MLKRIVRVRVRLLTPPYTIFLYIIYMAYLETIWCMKTLYTHETLRT